MVRTVWLGLFLLLGMGGLALFKFAFSPHQAVSLSKVAAFVSADVGTFVGGHGIHSRHLDEGRPVTNRVRGASHRCEARGNRGCDCSAAGPFRRTCAKDY